MRSLIGLRAAVVSLLLFALFIAVWHLGTSTSGPAVNMYWVYSFSEASIPSMLEMPRREPPQPPTTKVAFESFTGNVRPQKKSLPWIFMARRVHEKLNARNIVQIDCPVSGGVTGASKGTLAVMVSGPREEIKAIEPALSVLGRIFLIGEKPGAAQTMKLCNNFLSATAMTATSEAMVMGVKAGLDPRVMLDVINSSTGRNTATEDKFGRVILPRLFNLGFTNGLMTKDLKLCLQEGKALGVPMEVAETVTRMLQIACDEIGADADLTTVVKPVERRAGVEVRG